MAVLSNEATSATAVVEDDANEDCDEDDEEREDDVGVRSVEDVPSNSPVVVIVVAVSHAGMPAGSGFEFG